MLACSDALKADNNIDDLQKDFESLKQLAQKVEIEGKKDQYCKMRLMVIEKFLELLPNDIEQYPQLASYSQRDMATMISEEKERLNLILQNKRSPQKTIKRVKDSYPVVVNGHFEQDMIWSDGTVETNRPIYLFGFGHFHGMRKDIEWLGDLGINFSETEIGPRSTLKTETQTTTFLTDQFKTFLDKAYNSGVLVDILVSPHYTAP